MDVADAVLTARERTVAAGNARIALTSEVDDAPPPIRRRRGGLLGPVTARLGQWALQSGSAPHAEGVVDFAERRYAIDFGAYAELFDGARHWAGRSGRELSTLPPNPFANPVTPLWLVDALAGVTTADEREDGRLAIRFDLGRASAATPGGMAVPSAGERFESLLASPADVWLRDGLVRRVRYAQGRWTHTLDLWDHGAVPPQAWSRLPG